jgi:U3 small nucleolar RNA-associated protein 20
MHQLLYNYYTIILAKTEISTTRLAFSCILAYKHPFITPYKDDVMRILDDKTLRDELVNFDLGAEAGSLDSLHRTDIVPILVRVAFGRFLSKPGGKKARETNQSRRVAILTFVGKLSSSELRHLLHLMVRQIVPMPDVIPADTNTLTLTDMYSDWYDEVESSAGSMSSSALGRCTWERIIGFLYFVDPMIKVIGFGMTPYVETLTKLIMDILTYCQSIRENTVIDDAAMDESAVDVHTDGDVDDDADKD